MSEERPKKCPIEFSEIFDWDAEAAEQAGLLRYFDDELLQRDLYLIPQTWLEFIPENFPVVDVMWFEQLFTNEMRLHFSNSLGQNHLPCGVWIKYSGRESATRRLVNSDTD